MRTFLNIIAFSFCIFLFSGELRAADQDCSCPKVTCGPCQKMVTIGKVVKFCDWGDINVCRKVVCENVNFYFGCLSKQNKKATPSESEKVERGELELVYEKGEPQQKAKRGVASQKAVKTRHEKTLLKTEGRIEVDNSSRVIEGETYSDLVIGEASQVSSGIEIMHRGQKRALKAKQQFYVGDEIYNPLDKKVKLKIKFEKGSVTLTLLKKSKLIVHDPHSIVGRFQPFLYLVHGGVDFDVIMKEGSFDLLAGQILTRASQGNHRVNYEMGVEGLKVKVESFSNGVDVIRAQDLSGQKIKVEAGHFISWVSETPKHLFSTDEKQALAGEGFITPVFQMPEERRRKLGLIPEPPKSLFTDWNKNDKKRDPASITGDELCQAPAAAFQQCAWSCEGSKGGSGSCPAEKDDVHCVRRVCNAAGQWGVPTAFASSYKDLCPAQGVRVGDCTP